VGSLAALRRGSYATVALVFALLSVLLLLILVIVDVILQTSATPAAFVILVVLAVVFIVGQWAISPWIVRRAARVRGPVTLDTNRWLYTAVEDLARQAEVPMPHRVWMNEDPSPNAFVFGRTVASAELVVTAGLLEKLNQDEIRAVLAHEVGHLRHKDVIVMTLVSAVPILAYVAARAGFEFLHHGRPRGKGAGQAIAIAAVVALISYAVYLVTQMLVLYLSRTREYYADAYSGAATKDPHLLASALTKIAYGLSFARAADEPSGLRAFMIGDPVRAAADYHELQDKMSRYDIDRDGQLDQFELGKAVEAERHSHWRRANELFSTHPPTYARILMLEQLEEEIKRGSLPANVYEFV
jgi:heat shock protein HtpX